MCNMSRIATCIKLSDSLRDSEGEGYAPSASVVPTRNPLAVALAAVTCALASMGELSAALSEHAKRDPFYAASFDGVLLVHDARSTVEGLTVLHQRVERAMGCAHAPE